MSSKDIFKKLFKKNGDQKRPAEETWAMRLPGALMLTHHAASTKLAVATFEPNEVPRIFDEFVGHYHRHESRPSL